jgi:hypothetical protein
MGFKLVDTRDSLRVIFCCYAYDATWAVGVKRNTNDMIKTCSKYFLILELLVKQADNMEMAVLLDYKPTRYEGKGFLRKPNLRTHKDITGEMWFGVG